METKVRGVKSFVFAAALLSFFMGCGDSSNPDLKAVTEYLASVYPGYPSSGSKGDLGFARSLFFYYAQAPVAVFPNGVEKDRTLGWAGWQPVPGSFLYNWGALDGVPPGFPVTGVEDGTWVEVVHLGTDDVAFWMNYAAGSGIWWNVGHTLVGLNKTDALKRLGMTSADIVALWGSAAVEISEADVDKCTPPIEQWPAVVLQDYCPFDSGGTYQILDNKLVELGLQEGYDSLQMVKSWMGNNWLLQHVDLHGTSTVCGSAVFRTGLHQDQPCTCDPVIGRLNCAEVSYSRVAK